MPIQDYLTFNYGGKKGIVFTEFKEIGDFLVKESKAIYLGSLETSIGTYYKYEVENLSFAYRYILLALKFMPRK